MDLILIYCILKIDLHFYYSKKIRPTHKAIIKQYEQCSYTFNSTI